MPQNNRGTISNTTYVVAQSIAASFNGPAIEVQDARVIFFTIIQTITGGTSGTWKVQGSVDNGTWVDLPVTEASGYAANFFLSTEGYGARYLRIVYTVTVAGGASTASVQYSTRLH